MITATMFTTRSDLYKLTGIPDDSAHYDRALWDAGFDFDDWDWGICSDVPLTKLVPSGYENGCDIVSEHDAEWLINRMESWCVGYEYTEYGGKHYYIVHHA